MLTIINPDHNFSPHKQIYKAVFSNVFFENKNCLLKITDHFSMLRKLTQEATKGVNIYKYLQQKGHWKSVFAIWRSPRRERNIIDVLNL